MKVLSTVCVVFAAFFSVFLCKTLPAGPVGQPSPVDNIKFPYSQGIRNGVMTSGDACPTKEEMISKTRSLRMPFIANNGQVDEQVRFYAKTFGGTVFVTKSGEIVYALPESGDVEDGETHRKAAKCAKERNEKPISHKDTKNTEEMVGDPKSTIQQPKSVIALREEFIGAKVNAIQGEDPSVTKVNYFKGNDPDKWKTNVSTYDFVNLGEIYKGIGLKLKAYGNNVEKLFCVKPKSNPNQIKIHLSGAKSITVSEDGQLEVETELGPVKFTKPIAYQEIDGKRVEIAVEYRIQESRVDGTETEGGGAEGQGGRGEPETQNSKPETRNLFTVSP